jgi:hypothetical protein
VRLKYASAWVPFFTYLLDTGFLMKTEQVIFPSISSSFGEIRETGLLYIDKTIYIHHLLSKKGFKNWFLARPRRFGKTVLVDTLEQFFRGNEEFFRGLYIHSKDYDFKPCPVLRLNMARASDSKEILEKSIISHLEDIAEDEDLVLKNSIPAEALERLIKDLKKKHDKQPVVVLIDEYDKPILDHINKPQLAAELRDTLRSFYVGLKNAEENLRFVFVTGISKFAKTAIHSALNNLKDITHLPLFAGICGYTEKEFIDNFSPLFDNFLSLLIASGTFKNGDDQKVLINSILDKYNGYSWDGETRVLNPYSINNCFSVKALGNYWMDTGPPLLFEHAVSQNPTAYLQTNWENLQADDVDKTEIEDLRSVSVLFQTGYLTISKKTDVPKETFKADGSKTVKITTYYSLKIPNDEVLSTYKTDIFKYLFPFLSTTNLKNSCLVKLTNAILSKNAAELADILQAQLARIPYAQHGSKTRMWNNEPKLGEFFFQVIFQSFFDGLGLRDFNGLDLVKVIPEAMSSEGRSDIDIILPDNVYAVFELKYLPIEDKNNKFPDNLYLLMDKEADKALKQLENTLQTKKYINQSNNIISAGIVIYGRDIVLVKFTDNVPIRSRQ